METTEVRNEVRAAETLCVCPPKWAVLVDDELFPMPHQRIAANVIKAQASVGEGRTLVRDHNSPDDVVLPDGELVDLAYGNVFYTLADCDVETRNDCASPAKLAFVLNDRAEVTLRGSQTGRTLMALFNVPSNAVLVRDNEGRDDQVIHHTDEVRFADGPVFYTRHLLAALTITVNSRVFTEADGVKHSMTGREIAALVYPEAPDETRIWLVSPEKREIALGEHIEIHSCEVFDVVRKKVDGGYQDSRVERELDNLRASGQRVSLVGESIPAVVYHNLRTRPGAQVAATDVLVPVPGSYPGQMIDWAYLPDDSPLMGHVAGSPQNHRISALGRVWRQVSYHPHNGGGAPSWNPAVHGFHTYLGEILSWLYNSN